MSHGGAVADNAVMRTDLATAPIAAAGLIAGFAVAAASGSRPLGGAVLAAFGLWCIAIWLRRDGPGVALWLRGGGRVAFALSHGLGLVNGPSPALLDPAPRTPR